jgi:hypothetical protein
MIGIDNIIEMDDVIDDDAENPTIALEPYKLLGN